jgi:hypothetical protein
MTIMRTLVSLLTSVAFLLHMWLGCCVHHAHAVAESACTAHGEPAADSHRDHDPGVGTSGDESSEDSSCPQERCHDGHCVVLSTGKAEIAKDTLVVFLPPPVCGATCGFYGTFSANAIDWAGGKALTTRPHLLFQVLLI